MRCLALAQAWKDLGGTVAFVSREASGSSSKRLVEEAIDLCSPQSIPGTVEDAHETARIAGTRNGSWIVVDGYHFGSLYQKTIKDHGFCLLCLDDLGHAGHYYADIVVNQNIGADRAMYPAHEDYTDLLLGPSYVLLRREFQNWKNYQRENGRVPRKVLITIGGGDPDNVTTRVIEGITLLGNTDLSLAVIVGPHNPYHDQIQSVAVMAPSPVRIIENPESMPRCMAWADLAVSGAGSTCWELLYMGLPAAVIQLAENQRPIAEGLAGLGAVINLGPFQSLDPGRVAGAVRILLSLTPEQRKAYSGYRRLIDGDGAIRVVAKMKQHQGHR